MALAATTVDDEEEEEMGGSLFVAAPVAETVETGEE